MPTLTRRSAMLAMASTAFVPLTARAAGWPERPITIIVSRPPGGATDYAGRIVAQKMGDALPVPVVVENRSGATGSVGAAAVARSQPDGYTLLVAPISVFSVNPWFQPDLQFDPTKDFDLITAPIRCGNVLVAHPNYPVNSVAEMIAALKKDPGKITFASSGAGSTEHLCAVLFWQKTGTQGLHVPYRGAAPAVSDLIAGHVDTAFENINSVIEQIRAGKLKALAVTSEQRQATLPNVPTLSELGVKGVDAYSWQGFAGPKGLPNDLKQRLYTIVRDGLNAPAMKKQIEDLGLEVFCNSPAEFEAFAAQELERWRVVIQTAGIKP